MRILLVTEKYRPKESYRDGGARLIETIKKAFGKSICVMQFGPTMDHSANWNFSYPFNLKNRFEQRLANATFIATQIKAIEQHFTHVIFIHVSMQFGIVDQPLQQGIETWTFPMFLSPSYQASEEIIPFQYFEQERLTLNQSKNIITPSFFEKRQLIEIYAIPPERIHVIPRGINRNFIIPKIRHLKGPPVFCSIGSIKPQKNTLGLIKLFSSLQNRFPGATLKIIGPIQDFSYYETVDTKIQQLGLSNKITYTGYVAPEKISFAIQSAHFHLSTSHCETFGRSIFETLASGLPNVARATGNAAMDFLKNLPYIEFLDDFDLAPTVIANMLSNLCTLSSMACEIAFLYDEKMLSHLLVAKICQRDPIAISDFDGTLFHKQDPEKTDRSITAFQSFKTRILCSARPLPDLLEKLTLYNLTVHWIIAYSGGIIATGDGHVLQFNSLSQKEIKYISTLTSLSQKIEMEGKVLQIALPIEQLPKISNFRIETYQKTAFVAPWKASKLRAIQQLLRYIDWKGQVRVFGDGPYDQEMLTYFDGTLITENPCENGQKKEIENV